jgi:diguanylate cyclase (GGDEF)-like protein/PAS domain S-box-containing protein
VQGQYDLWTVILSFLIAWFAAFVAIQLAGRVREAAAHRTVLWIWAGGTALGLGIWSMHFMGMLAFHLPVPILYDLPMTAASVLPAILSSALALYIAGTRKRGWAQLLLAALMMGLGICVMHYSGMAAITFVPPPAWSIAWVAASFAVAVVVSLIALVLLTRFSWDRGESHFNIQVGAAALMGLGICGMHYTGMQAMLLGPETYCATRPNAVPGEQLSLAIVSNTLLFLAVMTVGSHRDQRRARQHLRDAQAKLTHSAEVRAQAEALAGELTCDLRASEQRFRTLVENTPGAMLMVDGDGRIMLANIAAEGLLGYPRTELIGQSVDILVPVRFRAGHGALSDSYSLIPQLRRIDAGRDMYCLCKNGAEVPVELRFNPLTVDDRQVVLATIIDLTERKQAEEHIKRLAYFDGLTGLPNRTQFQLRLAELVNRRGDAGFGLLFTDLDGFKEINDSLGHSAGDRVLTQVAQRLRDAVGIDGEVFRFGGDEFIVLLPAGNALRDGGIANELIRRISLPLRVEGEQLGVTLSIGSVRYPEHGDKHDLLLRRADNALYHAKAAGKNLHLRFQTDMEETVTRRFIMLNELRQAAERDQLVVLYQPVVELQSRRVIGAEALVYWDHPKHGRITPATFIPVAEENGLMESLGEWVLIEAIRQSAQWRAQGLASLRMAVNVSGTQFRNAARLRDAVTEALHRHDYPAGDLELEITERQIMYDPQSSIATMHALSDLGVVIALDDFGTGYSSLSYLSQFPLDKLKIDRSFIDQIDQAGPGRAIVRAVAELGNSLGMTVVAEGIERETQLAPLLACGCGEAQGYLFGRPMSATDFEGHLRIRLTA